VNNALASDTSTNTYDYHELCNFFKLLPVSVPFLMSVPVFHRRQHFKEHFIAEICVHVIHRNKSRTSISATETEVSVDVPDSPVADEVSTESPLAEVRTSEYSSLKCDANAGSTKAKCPRPARKSEKPPVKNEDLVPGAAFMGKVKSIQWFGAFVDFGAFTDGLVHISMLSDSYVKDVASVVSVGQEVKVKVIEVNAETRCISLSMRENADTGNRNDAPNNPEKFGPGRRDSLKSGPVKDKKTRNLL